MRSQLLAVPSAQAQAILPWPASLIYDANDKFHIDIIHSMKALTTYSGSDEVTTIGSTVSTSTSATTMAIGQPCFMMLMMKFMLIM